jgi:VanZ family protein
MSLWLPVLAYMALIFGLSSISSPPSGPAVLGDKGLHAILYSWLGALVVRALAGGWRRDVSLGTALFAVVICALYGVSDELHQYFVPPRQVEALDVVADAIGAAIAASGLYAYTIMKRS